MHNFKMQTAPAWSCLARKGNAASALSELSCGTLSENRASSRTRLKANSSPWPTPGCLWGSAKTGTYTEEHTRKEQSSCLCPAKAFEASPARAFSAPSTVITGPAPAAPELQPAHTAAATALKACNGSSRNLQGKSPGAAEPGDAASASAQTSETKAGKAAASTMRRRRSRSSSRKSRKASCASKVQAGKSSGNLDASRWARTAFAKTGAYTAERPAREAAVFSDVHAGNVTAADSMPHEAQHKRTSSNCSHCFAGAAPGTTKSSLHADTASATNFPNARRAPSEDGRAAARSPRMTSSRGMSA
mmetsp:Transcript_177783/g.570071  ORF Transcript_177783/g.570071 Transcript_177783/m.570071 type:complete len:304 (-) Transcript_177783:235-1146(-)